MATPLLSAASYALLHVGSGVLTGATMTLVLPPRAEDEAVLDSLGFVALQAALNGIAVYAAGNTIGQGDPTSGVVFLWALMASQPTFSARLASLASGLSTAAASHAASAAARAQGASP